MPNLLAMSFEGELAPSFDLRCLQHDRRTPDGWGLGYYPGGEPAASVLKERAPHRGSIRSELIKAWDHLESSLFVLHIRTARWGQISDANTQPFLRPWGRRDWMFGHAGSLRDRLVPAGGARFEPVGSTDTEAIFCDVLGRIAERGWQSLAGADLDVLRDWFGDLNEQGTMTCVLTDGRDLCLYADAQGETPVLLWRVMPPHGQLVFGDEDLRVDLTRRGIKSRKGVVLSSSPLHSESDHEMQWETITPAHLVLVRQGAVLADVGPRADRSTSSAGATAVTAARALVALPKKAKPRRLSVYHRTAYRYEKPVERSAHVLRLEPVHDRLQALLSHEVYISVEGEQRHYEDVFGNRVRRLAIEEPYTEMVIEARSRVLLLDTDPLRYRPLHARTAIPLVWMPWQRHMLEPYLLPPELPESELRELVEYAMSFVERNDYDLLDTLLDMNDTIHREYRYVQGSTTLATTAFDVYTERRGVCQDFANLFICLARLLGVPARYVCGYLYTGPKDPNRKQSEASHAWLQAYLPEMGWMGLDPTNGILTQTDHVRVAIGRSYVDATPTSGVIYVGGGPETLEVRVEVEPAD